MADTDNLSNIDFIKNRTIEIYNGLPQNREQRMKCLVERDEIISLNYKFFGYIASKKFISNPFVTYEDKFQSAVLHFCECWWKYKWQGDDTHRGYRQDLAFSVFFKPRITEMMERELDEVKYSIRRSLCMEVGQQLGKHWAKVTYEDLLDPRVKLPDDKMDALKAIFGAPYRVDFSEYEQYIEAIDDIDSDFENLSLEYDSVKDLLIHDMIELECKLTPKILKQMSEMYGIPLQTLNQYLPDAEEELRQRLVKAIELRHSMDD